MHSDDLPAFRDLIEDLCAAYNRPLNDRLVGVFFNSLKGVSFGLVRARAEIHRRTFKKFPSPADLRPDEKPAKAAPQKGPTLQEQLCDFLAKALGPRVRAGAIPAWQFSQPWRYEYKPVQWTDEQKRIRNEPAECSAVVVPGCDGHPAIRVTVEDMRQGYLAQVA